MNAEEAHWRTTALKEYSIRDKHKALLIEETINNIYKLMKEQSKKGYFYLSYEIPTSYNKKYFLYEISENNLSIEKEIIKYFTTKNFKTKLFKNTITIYW